MKILHILDHSIPLHSGYTFRTLAILEHQRKLGWETFQITSAKHTVAEAPVEIVDGLTFYRSPTSQGLLGRLPVLNQWAIVQSLAKRLDEIISEIKPDILHAHSPALNGLAAIQMASKYNLPLVYECRGFWEDAAVDHGTTTQGSVRYKLTRALETYVFRKATAVTTICEGLRADIIGRGIPAEKITVIPNAVDIDKFTYGGNADASLQQELMLKGKTVLGFIGSFYAYEGLLLLLDALPAVLKQRTDVQVLLVGGGPQKDLIVEKIAALGLADNIILTGRVPNDQVQRYYNLVDIFVYPRLSMRLTNLVTPLKPLEAMAQGRLVVASDVGGHKEMIRDRENGYLFKADDAVSLAQTILTVLDDQAHADDIRRAGRRYVEDERSWRRSVERYKDVYSKIYAEN